MGKQQLEAVVSVFSLSLAGAALISFQHSPRHKPRELVGKQGGNVKSGMLPVSDSRIQKSRSPGGGRSTYSGDGAYGGRQQDVVSEFPTVTHRR